MEWVAEREEALQKKGRENWDEDDSEEWEYLQDVKAENETCGIF